MKHENILNLCITALFVGIVYITTAFIKIPIPLGYANLGEAFILFAAFVTNKKTACIAGGFGSALADILSGFPLWALPTLVIKAVFALIAFQFFSKNKKLTSPYVLAGTCLAAVFAAVSYTLAGMLLYGSFAAGLSSFPGLFSESLVNAVCFFLLAKICPKNLLLFTADNKK